MDFGLVLIGVAAFAACCSVSMMWVVAISMSVSDLRFCVVDSVLVTVVLYEFQSVFRVCSRGAGVKGMTEVLIVRRIGVWSEERS